MSEGNRIDITIQGQTFRLRCEKGEADLLKEAAAMVDTKIAELAQGGVVDRTRAALMAAFHFAFELQGGKRESYKRSPEYRKLQKRLKTLMDEIDTNLTD